MQPINYRLDVESPFTSALQGMQAGFAIQDRQMQQQALQQQQLQQEQQQLQEQEMQADLAALYNKPDVSANDIARVTLKYPKLAEQLKTPMNVLGEAQKQNKISAGTQVYAALQSGQPEIAQRILEEQAVAMRNSGDEQGAKAAETLSELALQSPGMAKSSAGLFLASLMGPEKFASTFESFTKTPIETEKIGAEIRNIDSQIQQRADALNLDRDKLQSDMELKLYELGQKKDAAENLDGAAAKLMNDSILSSISAQESSNTLRDLAARLEKEGGGYGSVSSGIEWFREATGNQDAMSELRKEYLRVRNNQVMQALPPGSASDKDIELALSGFPKGTADSKTLATFLRGMAKMQDFVAVADNMKAEWVNSVGNLGKAKQDIEVDGIQVPAGTAFPVFLKKHSSEKIKQKASEESRSALEQVYSDMNQRYSTGASGQF